MYQQLGIILFLFGILMVIICALWSERLADFDWRQIVWYYEDIMDCIKGYLRPKPNILKYNYMSKNEPKKWKECEHCFKWGEPEKFIYLPKYGGKLELDVCRFCGKEFKSYSKTYYKPDETRPIYIEAKPDKHPKQKVKIEIEEITEDPRNI